MNKVLQILKKILNFIKEHKKIIIPIFILLVFIIGGIVIYNVYSKKVSDLEKIKIEEVSDKIINYIDSVEENSGSNVDKYILFALKYQLNENGTSIVSSSDIKSVIDETFDRNVSVDDIKNCGITSILLDNNVTYDSSSDTYYYHSGDLSMNEIAEKKINYYLLKNIIKINKDEYEVTYDKYTINNPYDVLNYYNDYNMKNDNNNYTDENGEVHFEENDFTPYDTTHILNYLKGTENEKSFRKNINSAVLENVGNKKYEIKIVYKLVDKKVLIKSINK